MIRSGLPAWTLMLVAAAIHSHASDRNTHEPAQAAVAGETYIRIDINPESRLTVGLLGPMPRPNRCGHAIELPVKIFNQAFVTAQLRVATPDDAPRGVGLVFDAKPLRGVPQESAKLSITLNEPGMTDLTIIFRFKHQMDDPAGHDRTHLLIDCNWEGSGDPAYPSSPGSAPHEI